MFGAFAVDSAGQIRDPTRLSLLTRLTVRLLCCVAVSDEVASTQVLSRTGNYAKSISFTNVEIDSSQGWKAKEDKVMLGLTIRLSSPLAETS